MAPQKTVLILGGSFAGISLAHYLLRHVLPSLEDSYRVVLVNPSRNFFFKIAAPRALVRPDLVPPETLMPEIETTFSEYTSTEFEFMQAYATNLNTALRQVHLQGIDGSSSVLEYEALVIATGTSSKSSLWSPRDPKEVTVDAMTATHQALQRAMHVVVVGGGAVGVEVAGELGSEFGNTKKITLYSGSSRLLTMVRPRLGRDAESYLTSLGVKVVHGVRLTGSPKSTVDKKTIVQLDNGETISADLVLDATGSKPNSEYIPKHLLDKKGSVKVDTHFRVAGAGPKVYSLGDIASYSHGGILDVTDAVAPLGSIMEYDLSNGKFGKVVEFKRNEKETMIVPVGRSKAVGVIFGYRIPSFLAWVIKGRTFMVSSSIPYSRGDGFKKKVLF